MLTQDVIDSRLLTYINDACCDFWTINPYRLCDHNCTYCITKAQGVSVPTFSARQSMALIREALSVIPPALTFAIGGFSDAYPDAEEAFRVTRRILELLCAERRPFAVITKGALVERDIDLLVNNPRAMVVLSFSTLDDGLAAGFELGAPPPSRRWATLEKLTALGVRTEISLSPWLPGVTDIREVLARAPAGVPIRVERLKIVRANRSFPIGNRIYSQAEIDELYLMERAQYSPCARLMWEFDPRFCRSGAGEEHPWDVAVRQHEREILLLAERGKLLPAVVC